MNNYIIEGIRNFDFSTYLKAMKVKYDSLELYLKNNDYHLYNDPNKNLVLEEWDNIIALTVKEAFLEENQEKRRALFSCLGPSRIFKEVTPKLLDRTVLSIQNKIWDQEGKESVEVIDDVYELYEIEQSKLVPTTTTWEANKKLRVVKCWCTTTGREYWIFVNHNDSIASHDAIKAIAWTFRVGIAKEDILEIYRQGDCLVIKAREGTEPLKDYQWWHLDKETYQSKLVAQS